MMSDSPMFFFGSLLQKVGGTATKMCWLKPGEIARRARSLPVRTSSHLPFHELLFEESMVQLAEDLSLAISSRDCDMGQICKKIA